MTSWSIRTSPAVLVPSLARITRLPWLCRSLLHHAASTRRGQNRAAVTVRTWQRSFARVELPSRRRLDRDHLEGVHVAVFAADRDIFAVAKCVVAEAIAGLVVVLRGLVVVEHLARVLGTAGLVDEAAEFVVLAIPESTRAAMFAVFRQRSTSMRPSASSGATNSYPGWSEPDGNSFERARLSRMRLSTCGNWVMTASSIGRRGHGQQHSTTNGSGLADVDTARRRTRALSRPDRRC